MIDAKVTQCTVRLYCTWRSTYTWNFRQRFLCDFILRYVYLFGFYLPMSFDILLWLMPLYMSCLWSSALGTYLGCSSSKRREQGIVSIRPIWLETAKTPWILLGTYFWSAKLSWRSVLHYLNRDKKRDWWHRFKSFWGQNLDNVVKILVIVLRLI